MTGASTGIGRAFAELFAAEGWTPVLVARDRAALDAVAAALKERYAVDAPTIALDLGVLGAAQQLVDAVRSLGIDIDALINNAGFATFGKFQEIPIETERAEMLLNVVTLTELTKLVVPKMLARGGGRICNVASTAAFLPGPLMAVYYATKAYVLSFSEALCEELRGSGVTVTCLCPGATASNFQRRARIEETPLVKGRRLPSADAVARAGYAATMSGKRLVIPGASNALVVLALRFSPRALVVRISRALLSARA